MSVIYKGKIAKSDDTFLRLLVPQGSQFMLTKYALQGKKWTRFRRFIYDDYCCMSEDTWDAICLVPKINITLMGFGWLNTYEQGNFTLTFKIIVDSTEYPE